MRPTPLPSRPSKVPFKPWLDPRWERLPSGIIVPQRASISYVGGGNSGTITVSPTSPYQFTVNMPSSDLVVGFIRYTSASANVTGITDTAGNSYTVNSFIGPFGSNTQIQVFYAYAATGNSSNQFSVTYSGTAGFMIGVVDWFSGTKTSGSPYDSTMGQHTTGSTSGGTITSSSFTTSLGAEMVYVALAAEQVISSWSTSSGYTAAQATPGSNGAAAASFYNVYSSIQSGITVAFVQSSGAAGGMAVNGFEAPSGTQYTQSLNASMALFS